MQVCSDFKDGRARPVRWALGVLAMCQAYRFSKSRRFACQPSCVQSITLVVSWLVVLRYRGVLNLQAAARDPVSRALGVLAMGHAIRRFSKSRRFDPARRGHYPILTWQEITIMGEGTSKFEYRLEGKSGAPALILGAKRINDLLSYKVFSCFGGFERELRAQTVIAVRVAID